MTKSRLKREITQLSILYQNAKDEEEKKNLYKLYIEKIKELSKE